METSQCCHICKKTDVRLYRPYQSFFRSQSVRCNNHLTEDEMEYYVPCIWDKDGSVWGYTSVPKVDCDKFYALPESNPEKMGWNRTGFSF